MHCVQIGDYCWVGRDGKITMSGTHAMQLAAEQTARDVAQNVRNNGKAYVDGASLTKAFAALVPTLPVTVVPAAQVEARVAATQAAAPKPAPARLARPDGPRDGVTRRVYQWTLDNPQATKADALAAFPSANPGTVGVQFGAARKAGRI